MHKPYREDRTLMFLSQILWERITLEYHLKKTNPLQNLNQLPVPEMPHDQMIDHSDIIALYSHIHVSYLPSPPLSLYTP